MPITTNYALHDDNGFPSFLTVQKLQKGFSACVKSYLFSSKWLITFYFDKIISKLTVANGIYVIFVNINVQL